MKTNGKPHLQEKNKKSNMQLQYSHSRQKPFYSPVQKSQESGTDYMYIPAADNIIWYVSLWPTRSTRGDNYTINLEDVPLFKLPRLEQKLLFLVKVVLKIQSVIR